MLITYHVPEPIREIVVGCVMLDDPWVTQHQLAPKRREVVCAGASGPEIVAKSEDPARREVGARILVPVAHVLDEAPP